MKIRNDIINTRNITYVGIVERSSNGYILKENTTLFIYFIGEQEALQFVFYKDSEEDMQMCKEIIKRLEELL